MHGEAEHPVPQDDSESALLPVAGAGLYGDSSDRHLPGWTNWFVGVVAVLIVGGLGAGLWVANPAFSAGTALGTTDQIGKPAASAGGANITPGSPVVLGRQAIIARGCGSCHTIPGIPGAAGSVGPNLAGVASRPTIAGGAVTNSGPDSLKAWVLDPPGQKPGTLMPKLGLSDDEAANVAAYLESLK